MTVEEVKGGAAEVWARVNALVLLPLLKPDLATEPWWEFVLLRGSRFSILLFRVHHTLG